MEGTRFRLLGPMEISRDGRPVPLPSSAERALLAQLLLGAGRLVPATTLIERLWSGSATPVDPVNALQTRVSKLRRSLAAGGLPDLVTREGVGYRALVPPDAVDAVSFDLHARAARASTTAPPLERLRAHEVALSLWHGEPLVDFTGQAWATSEAARLRALWVSLLEVWADLALVLDRAGDVMRRLGPIVAADPAEEALAGRLMTALYRSGRQAEALEVFSRTREHLVDELGLEPSAPLRRTHELVLRQDASLLGAPDASRLSTGEGPDPTTAERPALRNLPTVERRLIGREQRLLELDDLLTSSRLVTLVGPGGAGKTSLASVAALRAAERFGDGVVGVALGSVDSPDRVPSAFADALQVPVDSASEGIGVIERVITFVGAKELLLVVDNCEHVIDAVAELVDLTLSRCPSIRVLATSREALAIPREVQVPVGPLDTPPAGTAAGSVLDFAAAELFLERARAVRPGLELSASELLDVAEIVRALDGIPLAIELAVARVALMSTAEIRSRLSQRFSLLTSGARTAAARQRTLRATVDWSYALLVPAEQRAFERLSVCQGGWTLETAEALLGGQPEAGDVLHVIARLVEQSMVVADAAATSRYRMLETLRHYAAGRLVDSGAAPEARLRHAEHFRALALRFEAEVHGARQREALRRVATEIANIEVALDWFAGEGDDIDSALQTAGALALFWQLRRPLEGRELLERLLSGGRGSTIARARALQALSIVGRPRASLVHPSPLCARAAAESLSVFEATGDTARAALSKVLLAVEGVAGSAADRSARLLEEAEAEFAREGGVSGDWGRAYVAYVRMEIALKHRGPDHAAELGNAAASAFRSIDDRWGLSGVLQHLGRGMREYGRYDEAEAMLREALVASRAAGKDATVPWILAEIGILLALRGERAQAERAFHDAVTASRRVGDGAGAVLASHGTGLLHQLAGDRAAARFSYTEAVDGFRLLGTPEMEAFSLCNRAECHEALEDDERAGSDFRAALDLGRTWSEPAVIASALEGLARLSVREGNPEAAALHVAEAARVRARSGRAVHPVNTSSA